LLFYRCTESHGMTRSFFTPPQKFFTFFAKD
jgi:hypothetical protein